MAMTKIPAAHDVICYATSPGTGQEARTGADMSLANNIYQGERYSTCYPFAFCVGTSGLVVLENADADARGISAIAGRLYRIKGIKGKQPTVLDDANTTADIITFYYARD